MDRGSNTPGTPSRPTTPGRAAERIQHTVDDLTNPEDRSLVRAVPLTQVTKGLGHVLQSCAGTEEGYRRSQEAIRIHDFLSHNWSTGRWQKFFALSLHYNGGMASVALYATGVIVAIVSGFVKKPQVPVPEEVHPSQLMFFNCAVCGVIVFLCVLSFGTEIKQIFGFQRLVFLDKLCIDQSSAERKSAGIKCLATFLSLSDCMVIVYSPKYFRRLWTVYEVASYLTLNGTGKILISPDFKPGQLALFGGLPLVSSVMWLLAATQVPSSRAKLQTLLRVLWVIGLVLSYCFMSRYWCRKVHNLKKAIEEFSVQNAECLVEDDRRVVYSNIDVFMKYLGKVPATSPMEDALNAFNALVRKEMPAAMEASFGPNLISYDLIMMITSYYTLAGLDHMVAIVADGGAWEEGVKYVGWSMFVNFVAAPLVNCVMGRVYRAKMHLVDCQEVCLVLLYAVIFVVPTIFVLFIPAMLTGPNNFAPEFNQRHGKVIAFLPFVMMPVMLLLVVRPLYRAVPVAKEVTPPSSSPDAEVVGAEEVLSPQQEETEADIFEV